MEIGDEKTNIVVLDEWRFDRRILAKFQTYGKSLSTQDMEIIRTLHHETHQSLAKDLLEIVGLDRVEGECVLPNLLARLPVSLRH